MSDSAFPVTARIVSSLSRSDAIALAAEMARHGLHCLSGYDDPEFDWVEPLDGCETQAEVKRLTSVIFQGAMARKSATQPAVTI